MEDYYRRRAEEYEEVYYRNDPVRQQELRQVEERLMRTFKGRQVLEVACGTGYWTRMLSEIAESIVPIDIAPEMLEIARRKSYECPVAFQRADANELPFQDGVFNGGAANFWFSHIPKKRLPSFLKELHRVLKDGSMVFMADNVYIQGIGGELVSKEGDENTYKLRKLKNGSEHLVLKNYFSVQELLGIFGGYAKGLGKESIYYGECYWSIAYEVD